MALDPEFEKVLAAVCEERGWTRDKDTVVVPTEGGREQRVNVDAFEFEDEALVRFASGIGPTRHIESLHLTTALRLNYGLAHGALALRDEELVIVDTVLQDEPDAEEIDAVVEYLAEIADHFERTLFGTDEL